MNSCMGCMHLAQWPFEGMECPLPDPMAACDGCLMWESVSTLGRGARQTAAESSAAAQVSSRLPAANRVFRPNDSPSNLPFVILQNNRPLRHQLRPLSGNGCTRCRATPSHRCDQLFATRC